MNDIIILFLYFCFCAFLGWIIESAYRSAIEKRFINSGFLYGPFVPIYGFGGLLIYILDVYTRNLFFPARCIAYFLLPTIIEYMTSYLFEKIFRLKLWDYSNIRFNFQGRICLKFSLFWFGLVLLDIFFIQTPVIDRLRMLPESIAYVLSVLFFVYFSADMFFSVKLYRRFVRIKTALKTLLAMNNDMIIEKIFNENPILLKMKDILKPILAFPNLMNYIQSELSAFIENLERKSIQKVKSRSNILFNYNEDQEFLGFIRDIINHPEFQKLKNIHHHEHSIYEHSLHVSRLSYLAGKRIGKYVKLNLSELTRGAVLHDFFLYDWRKEKPASGKLHAFEHPKEALRNSQKYFSPVSAIEKDIILKHMWPLNVIPPRYMETMIVVIIDKLVASKELFVEMVENKQKNKKES